MLSPDTTSALTQCQKMSYKADKGFSEAFVSTNSRNLYLLRLVKNRNIKPKLNEMRFLPQGVPGVPVGTR